MPSAIAVRDFLVVQRIAGRLDQPAAIGHRRPAPAIQKPLNRGARAFGPRKLALLAERAGMGDELIRRQPLFLGPGCSEPPPRRARTTSVS